MSIQFRQLLFLRKYEVLSRRSISRASGIPTYTLYRVEKQIAILPKKYRTSLRRLYERQAYSTLRDEGMSVSQASKFKSFTPEKVMITRGKMKTIVQHLREGVYAMKSGKLDKLGISFDPGALWGEVGELVKKGLRRSKKDMEAWEEY